MSLVRGRLALAWQLDRWERRARRLGEKFGWPQAWIREFAEVTGDPRITLEEFWVRYAVRRERAQEQMLAVKTEEDALGFYATSDYPLYRQLMHRRHTPWRVVRAGMGRRGRLLEFGCGIAPVSAWLARRRPDWDYVLVDVPGTHREYAQARLPRSCVSREIPIGAYDVITALDVLEHLSDPLTAATRLASALRLGGLLYWNFDQGHGDLNLATPGQREETITYLLRALHPVWCARDLIVSVKEETPWRVDDNLLGSYWSAPILTTNEERAIKAAQLKVEYREHTEGTAR